MIFAGKFTIVTNGIVKNLGVLGGASVQTLQKLGDVFWDLSNEKP